MSTPADPKKLFYRQSGSSFTHKVTGVLVEKPRVLMHVCMHPGCERWGCLSVGARWKDGVPGTWWCAEHFPAVNEIERPSRHADPASTQETADVDQGNGTGRNADGPDVDDEPRLI